MCLLFAFAVVTLACNESIELSLAVLRLARVLANEVNVDQAVTVTAGHLYGVAHGLTLAVWAMGWFLVPVLVGILAARAQLRRDIERDLRETRVALVDAFRDKLKPEARALWDADPEIRRTLIDMFGGRG